MDAATGPLLRLLLRHSRIYQSISESVERGAVAGKCDVCEKKTRFGRHIRHKASGRWERKATKHSRQFRPNVHKKRLFVDGKWQRVNICTRCLRTQIKHMATA
jgi:large subunit ribosomal protein L28